MDDFELYRPPTYEKLKIELEAGLLAELDELVAYVKTLSAWHKEHASRDSVIEYLVDRFLSSNSKAVVSWKREQSD